MDTVHVFISAGRFRSLVEMRAFIDQRYTEEGDAVPSEFMREVQLSEYQPECIEAILSDWGQLAPLSELLAGASYSDQWLDKIDRSRAADAAICVFGPNNVARPEQCSLEYLGAFRYGHKPWRLTNC
jgi:hypothetical protein